MATWEDGPEYAPAQRPGHFEEPSAPPISRAPETVDPVPLADQLPPGHPGYGRPDAPPLEVLGLTVEQSRDPAQPYRTAAAALTAFDDAPRRAHGDQPPDPGSDIDVPEPDFDPTRPMRDLSTLPAPDFPAPQGPPAAAAGRPDASPYPQPGTPQWFGPSAGPAPRLSAPGFGELVAALTPPVALFLLLAGLIYPLSLPLFVVAMFCSVRIRYRRRMVRNVFLGGLGGGLTLSLLVLALSANTFGGWWIDMSWLMLVTSWVVLIVLGFIQARALQRGERPEQA